MGGGLSILLANKLLLSPINGVNFIGSVLLCPLLKIHKEPPVILQMLLIYCFAPLFSTIPMFSFLQNQASNIPPGQHHIIYEKYSHYDDEQVLLFYLYQTILEYVFIIIIFYYNNNDDDIIYFIMII